MSEFAFARADRVTLPAETAGAESVQAVITARKEITGREPEYELQWLSADTAGEKGVLDRRYAAISESVLIAAQPPAMISAVEAQNLAGLAYHRGMADLTNEIVAEKEARAAKRGARRKQASKRKR